MSQLAVLEEAEARLRAEGILGSDAADVLIDALRRHAGLPTSGSPAHASLLAGLELHPTFDLVGVAWQRWFPGLYRSRFGQFFTPRPVARLMVNGLGSLEGRSVLDPTCGAGGLLLEASRAGARVSGIELDARLARLAEARLASVDGSVSCADAFLAEVSPVDAVVANPPFSVPSEQGVSEDRFVQQLAAWVRPGGRAAVVLPWSLWRDRRGAQSRAVLLEAFRVDAVCALPEGVFRPHGGAGGRAVVVWLTREAASSAHRVRFASVVDPGWDVGSEQLRLTDATELDTLMSGQGWRDLEPGALWPRGSALSVSSRPLRALVTETAPKFRPSRQPHEVYGLIELADVDRTTGEVGRLRRLEGAALRQHKLVLEPADVVVSRLRPELNTIGVVPSELQGPLAGSTEWIALRGLRLPWFVAHALRTAAWRSTLGATEGQVRPRVRREQVLDSEVPWPGDDRAERANAVLRDLHQKRRELALRLAAVEDALGDWASGEADVDRLDAALDAARAALESPVRPQE